MTLTLYGSSGHETILNVTSFSLSTHGGFVCFTQRHMAKKVKTTKLITYLFPELLRIEVT